MAPSGKFETRAIGKAFVRIDENDVTAGWENKESPPIVSICCATFNHEQFIHDAMHGFLSQRTLFPFEILVHDDASTDNTLEVVRDYQSRFPSIIRVIAQSENQYSKGRRIVGELIMPEAKGQYLAICEGDDYWTDPEKLAKQVRFLENNPDYVLCYSDCVGLDQESGNTVKVAGVRWDLSERELQETASIFTLTTCFRNVLHPWPVEVSRAPYGDLTLWSLLGDHGKGKFLRDIGSSRYRMHTAGLHSMQTRNRKLQMSLETLMTLCLFRVKRGEMQIAKAHIENIVVLSFKLFGSSLVSGIFRRSSSHFAKRIWQLRNL